MRVLLGSGLLLLLLAVMAALARPSAAYDVQGESTNERRNALTDRRRSYLLFHHVDGTT